MKAVKDARRSFIDNEDDSDAEHTACSGHTGKQASTANAERPARLVEQPEAQEVMTEQEKDAIVALQALGRDMRAKKQELGWQAITPACSHLRVECGYGSENEEEDVNGTEIGDRARGEAWERDCCLVFRANRTRVSRVKRCLSSPINMHVHSGYACTKLRGRH